MTDYADRTFEYRRPSHVDEHARQRSGAKTSVAAADQRPSTARLNNLTVLAGSSVRSRHLAQLQTMLDGRPGNTLQLASKKNRRKQKQRADGIAYNEKLEQRVMDRLVGPDLRQRLDLANPLRSDADRRADMVKLSNMEDEDRTAWSKSLQATLHLQPEGYVPTVSAVTRRGFAALTSFADQKKEVQVQYDSDDVADLDGDERTGRMAATFTHELAVHGPNLHGDPDSEHAAMSSPEERDAYLTSVHRTFSLLDNAEQQAAFAEEWLDDIIMHLDRDDDLDNRAKRQRKRWAREEYRKMMMAIDHPNNFAWA